MLTAGGLSRALCTCSGLAPLARLPARGRAVHDDLESFQPLEPKARSYTLPLLQFDTEKGAPKSLSLLSIDGMAGYRARSS